MTHRKDKGFPPIEVRGTKGKIDINFAIGNVLYQFRGIIGPPMSRQLEPELEDLRYMLHAFAERIVDDVTSITTNAMFEQSQQASKNMIGACLAGAEVARKSIEEKKE